MLLTVLAQAARTHCLAPTLGLLPIMVAHGSFAAAAAALATAGSAASARRAATGGSTGGAAPAEPAAAAAASCGGAGALGCEGLLSAAIEILEDLAAALPAGGAEPALLAAVLQSRLLAEAHAQLSALARGGAPASGAGASAAASAAGDDVLSRSMPLPSLGALSRASSCGSSGALLAGGAALRARISASSSALQALGGGGGCGIGGFGALPRLLLAPTALTSPAGTPCVLSACASPLAGAAVRRPRRSQPAGLLLACGVGGGPQARASCADGGDVPAAVAAAAAAAAMADVPEWPEGAEELAALQARLDAVAARLASAALSVCGGGGGGAAADAARSSGGFGAAGGHYLPRASSCEDALASLRAAVAALPPCAAAAAAADAPSPCCLASPPAPPPAASPLPAPLLLARCASSASAGESLPLAALSPRCSETEDSSSAGSAPFLEASPAAALPGSLASASSLCGSCGTHQPRDRPVGDAAAAAAVGALPARLAGPLPPAASAKLLRSLSSAAPAVARAAVRAAAAATAGGPGVASGLVAGGVGPDPVEALPRQLPALAALRVGCASARCASLAGASEAAAPLKPCAGGCGAAAFCSRACANAAFGAHRAECEAARAAGGGSSSGGGAAAPDVPLARRESLEAARARRLSSF